MKKYLFILLLSFSTAIFACSKCVCNDWLYIVIVNSTNTSCHLYSQSLEDGAIYTRQLPLEIQKGTQSAPYNFVGNKHYSFVGNKIINVSLSYQCGDDKFVTIQSQRIFEEGFFTDEEKLSGIVTSSSNLDATYSSKASECDIANKPAVIYWTLH